MANAVGLSITRHRKAPSPKAPSPDTRLFEALLYARENGAAAMPFLAYCATNLGQSHAQLFQDLLVLFTHNEKRNGYFVEFGATDGVSSSNTLLLERNYGWRGIVAEPGRRWHRALRQNRSCAIEERLVWSKSGEALQFNETTEAELSTINELSQSDFHAKLRRSGSQYVVDTISLRDLLVAHDAPQTIDYLSVDTEGSELAILSSFFPTDHDVRVITVEHNYTDQRAQMHRLLTDQGYLRVFEELSMWDDWYIKAQ